MGHRSPLPDEILTTLPPVVRDYIDALETALSNATGEAAELRSRMTTLERTRRAAAARRGWPKGFIERTAGAWQGEPPVRPEQGEYEEREPIA